MLLSYFPTLYNQDTLLLGDYSICSLQPSYTTFFVDSVTTTVVISATSGNTTVLPSIAVTNPSGVTIPLATILNQGNLAVVLFIPQAAGAYGLKVSTSAGSCSFRVRGTTGFDMFGAYTSSINTDITLRQPVYSKQDKRGTL